MDRKAFWTMSVRCYASLPCNDAFLLGQESIAYLNGGWYLDSHNNIGVYMGMEYAEQTDKRVRYLEENMNAYYPMPHFLYYHGEGDIGENPLRKRCAKIIGICEVADEYRTLFEDYRVLDDLILTVSALAELP